MNEETVIAELDRRLAAYLAKHRCRKDAPCPGRETNDPNGYALVECTDGGKVVWCIVHNGDDLLVTHCPWCGGRLA